MPPSYLAGEWRPHGWWYYYIYGMMVKFPVGTLGVLLLSAIASVRDVRRGVNRAASLSLWVAAGIILIAISAQDGFSHHFRYALPLLPFAYVMAGNLGARISLETPWRGLLVVGLVVYGAASSLGVYPHSLSYFNEIAGGPDRGHEHMVDSNIDWGQDVFFFASWVQRHPEASDIGLAYHSPIDYRVPGVEYAPVPAHPRPGWFGVDIKNLKRPGGDYRYFGKLQPIAKAGYSIFIFYITLAEANRLRDDMGLPLLQ